ncbi:MAG TPA: ACT domain-containing protein [Bryobacteraceae bacterium]|nr:ACT domain-containing protein [Bryobacteraceae bacterium]
MQQPAYPLRQVIEVSLEDKPGALMRVTGIMTAKGINIDTLSLSPDPKRPGLARITLSARVEERYRSRVLKEMNRLVQVLRAVEVT